MTIAVDKFILQEMKSSDNEEVISSFGDGSDEMLESMMETASRNEISDKIFPLEERYKQEIDDYDVVRIAEALANDGHSCNCGKLTGVEHDGEKCPECNSRVKKGGKKNASD